MTCTDETGRIAGLDPATVGTPHGECFLAALLAAVAHAREPARICALIKLTRVRLSPQPTTMFTAALLPYTQYVIFFVSGFMVIPTGRDFFAPGYPIMPGDPELFAAMNKDPVAHPTAAFMWRTFGFNFVLISILKYIVLLSPLGVVALMPFCIAFTVHALIAIGILAYYKPKFAAVNADITPFLGLFLLEGAAWVATILS